MITKESFYELMAEEKVAIKCEDAHQWRFVYDNMIARHPKWDNEDMREYNPSWPYLVYWGGLITGFNGSTNEHPRRFTFAEFASIVTNADIPEDDIEEMGDVL